MTPLEKLDIAEQTTNAIILAMRDMLDTPEYKLAVTIRPEFGMGFTQGLGIVESMLEVLNDTSSQLKEGYNE